jgi:hypothetical protein
VADRDVEQGGAGERLEVERALATAHLHGSERTPGVTGVQATDPLCTLERAVREAVHAVGALADRQAASTRCAATAASTSRSVAARACAFLMASPFGAAR